MKQGVNRLLHACTKGSTYTLIEAHSINTVTGCDVLHVLKCELQYVTWHEKTGLMCTKYTYSYYGTYLLYG